MTLVCQAFSRLRCCTGVSLSSTITRPMPSSSTASFSRSTTPLPSSVAGVTRRSGAVCGQTDVEVDGARQSDGLVELGLAVAFFAARPRV